MVRWFGSICAILLSFFLLLPDAWAQQVKRDRDIAGTANFRYWNDSAAGKKAHTGWLLEGAGVVGKYGVPASEAGLALDFSFGLPEKQGGGRGRLQLVLPSLPADGSARRYRVDKAQLTTVYTEVDGDQILLKGGAVEGELVLVKLVAEKDAIYRLLARFWFRLKDTRGRKVRTLRFGTISLDARYSLPPPASQQPVKPKAPTSSPSSRQADEPAPASFPNRTFTPPPVGCGAQVDIDPDLPATDTTEPEPAPSGCEGGDPILDGPQEPDDADDSDDDADDFDDSGGCGGDPILDGDDSDNSTSTGDSDDSSNSGFDADGVLDDDDSDVGNMRQGLKARPSKRARRLRRSRRARRLRARRLYKRRARLRRRRLSNALQFLGVPFVWLFWMRLQRRRRKKTKASLKDA